MSEPTTCPECHHPMSEWFQWPGVGMYCFLCWVRSGYQRVISVDGEEAGHE